MPLSLISSLLNPIITAVGGSPVQDLPVVGGLFGPTGGAGAGGQAGLVPVGGDVVESPLALASNILGIPFEILASALELVGVGGEGVGQGPGGLLGMGGAVKTTRTPTDVSGFSGGNGRTANRTVVQTLDLVTGQIVRNRILAGTPYMMNSDIRAAKKVFRQSADLHGRMPRRTVKESETTKLKNAAVQQAIAHVSHPHCPPQ